MIDATPASASSSAEDETLQVDKPARHEPPTDAVSRYVALEEVGRGGMGRVLRAYDPKLQREVALKEVHRDLLDDEAAVRLVAEARAMAQLTHPNVVAVYDVEERDRSNVVLIMEFVPGQTLKAWLREGLRPWQDVVSAFRQAGRGLAAAHEAGLLHRDFKPANVLVADGGAIKVTDFGIAKRRASSGDASSLDGEEVHDDLTDDGLVMGTPRYMAPEQHIGAPLDPTADQYAFCVALWEGLCGKPPFSGRTIGSDKNAGPPPWPEAKVPRPIADAIVRGLAVAPRERWPSMAALLDALSWTPTRRRNRRLAIGGAAITVLAAGAGYDVWSAARARRCSGASAELASVWDDSRREAVISAFSSVDKPYASASVSKTLAALDDYAGRWTAMHTEACKATAVRKEQSPAALDLRMSCLDRALVDLGAALDVLADADATVVQRAHHITDGLFPVDRCADVGALSAGVEPPLPAEAGKVAEARKALATARNERRAGLYEASLETVHAANATLRGVDYGPVQTEFAVLEGTVLKDLGRYTDAETKLATAMRIGAQHGQWEEVQRAAALLMHTVGAQQKRIDDALLLRPIVEGLSDTDPLAEASFRTALASVFRSDGAFSDAVSENRKALELRLSTLGPDHLHVASSRRNLANALSARGDYADAEVEHRRALGTAVRELGAEHPVVASARNSLALVLARRGKYEEAEREHRRALESMLAALAPTHPDVADARSSLAIALAQQGKNELAEQEFRTVIELRRATFGSNHPEVASARNNLASLLGLQGKYAEAEPVFRAVIASKVATLGPTHPDVADARANLALALDGQGKAAEAVAEYRSALAMQVSALGPEHPHVASTRNNLAGVLAGQGKHVEAEGEYRLALDAWLVGLGPDHRDVAMARHSLGATLVALGREADALPIVELAWARRQRDDVAPVDRADTAFQLARILWMLDGPNRDRARALDLAKDAYASYQDGGAFQENADEVQRWLEQHHL